MPITIFVNPKADDVAGEWTCSPPALTARLEHLIRAGWRFFPAERTGRFVGEVAKGMQIKDRNIADLVSGGLIRLLDTQGDWEAKVATPLTAEEAAGCDTIAIRGPANRTMR
jgi:hypothetical protein